MTDTLINEVMDHYRTKLADQRHIIRVQAGMIDDLLDVVAPIYNLSRDNLERLR